MRERIRELLYQTDELISELSDTEELTGDDKEPLMRLMDQVYDLMEEADQYAFKLGLTN